MTTVRIDLDSLNLNFNGGENLKIKLDQGVVRSDFDNSLSESITYNYTVDSTAPPVNDTTPDLGETNSYVATVEFVFNDRIRVESGNFYLYEDTNPDTLIATIPYNDLRVNVTADGRIRIDVSGYLESQTTYYVISDPNIIENHLGISTGINSEDIVKWTTGLVAPEPLACAFTLTMVSEVSGANVDRNFLSNQSNSIFVEHGITLSEDDTYTFQFTATSGEFWKNGVSPGSSFSITDTRYNLLTELIDWKYYPVLNSTSNDSISVKVLRGNNLIDTPTFNMIYNGVGSIDKTLTWTSSTSWVPDYEDVKYKQYYDLILVGGGGGASYFSGGGGGMVVSKLNASLAISANNTYTIDVGGGGSPDTTLNNCNSNYAGNGSRTNAFGLQAMYGSGAASYWCYTSSGGYQTTWQIQGGDSWYGTGTPGLITKYEGYNQDSGTVFYQRSAASGFYDGPGAGAGGVGTNLTDGRGPSVVAWDSSAYGLGGSDGNDDTTTGTNYTLQPGEGGSAQGYYNNSYARAPGQPGLVKLRIRGY